MHLASSILPSTMTSFSAPAEEQWWWCHHHVIILEGVFRGICSLSFLPLSSSHASQKSYILVLSNQNRTLFSMFAVSLACIKLQIGISWFFSFDTSMKVYAAYDGLLWCLQILWPEMWIGRTPAELPLINDICFEKSEKHWGMFF